MADNIVPFNFESQEVRIVTKGGELWFVAADVACAVDYRDATALTRLLDEDEKDTHNISTLGGNQDVLIISESGLYHAIVKSRKPQAKRFRKWITSEVLPSIRKTGSYSLKQDTDSHRSLPPADIRLAKLTDALQYLNIDPSNPRWSSGLKDLALNILGIDQYALPASAEATERWRGVVEIANEMGYPQASDLGVRSSLGTYVSRLAIASECQRKREERLCNGTNRKIWVYLDTPELRRLIQAYFDRQQSA